MPGWGALPCLVLCADALNASAVTRTPTVVLHLHGGAFCSMSPATHEAHVRRWALKIALAGHQAVPIISVDYALAPEAPYPGALDQICEIFAMLHDDARAAEVFGISGVRSVIVTGDSAGGCLAAGLAVRTILAPGGGPKPAALLLSYPTLLGRSLDSATKLRFAADCVVPLAVIRAVRSFYAPDGCASDDDPCLSPLLADDAVLAAFPRTTIVCGDKDPLVNDARFFARRLQALGAACSLTEMPGMPHAFLNLGALSADARDAVRQTGDLLSELVRVNAL